MGKNEGKMACPHMETQEGGGMKLSCAPNLP